MSDFSIQGTLNGTAVVPPFYVTKQDWASKTGPFDSEAAARNWIGEQLMPNTNIASVDALVKTITAQVANLSNLQKRLADTSSVRDRLLQFESEHSINQIDMTFFTKSGSSCSVSLYGQSEGQLVADTLSKSVITITRRIEKQLEEISKIAAALHTPSS